MKTHRYDPKIHHRRSIRLKRHDYAGGGVYFVTICAHHEFIQFAHGNPFGVSEATCVSPVHIIEEEWRRCGEVRDDVFPGEFIVMADHFHGLIRIEPGASELGHVIGAFKAAVSRRIRRGDTHVARTHVAHTHVAQNIRIWHRNYYEMIVRTPEVDEAIAGYIRMNPWKNIIHLSNGMRGIGNPGLLNCKKIGTLCSRNCPKNSLDVADRRASNALATHCLISGFHSPPERTILAALLKSHAKIICCPSWGIDTLKIPVGWLPALEANRMLILEIQSGKRDLAAARERNIFIMQTADELWLPHVSHGGMLARLIQNLSVEDKIIRN